MLPLPLTLSSELVTRLAEDDAERSLEGALRYLSQLGIQQRAATASPLPIWVEVEVGARRLELVATQPISDELRDVVAPLLRLALQRAQLQSQLQSTHERLELLSSASFEGIFAHVGGTVIEANQRLADMLGCERHELLGPHTMARCVAPEDLAATVQRVQSGYEGAYQITGVRWNGSRFRAELQSKQSRLGERPVRVVAVRDVTERERTLSLLRDSEQHLRDLAQAAFDFMVLTRHGKVVDVGGAYESVLGYRREELLGRAAVDFVSAESRAETERVLGENRAGRYEAVIVSKRGEKVPVEIMGVHSSLDGEAVRVAGFKDLRENRRQESERRKLERQLERSQRLESLGVLAGGIAHDFNNLLVGVIGNAGLLLASVSQPPEQEAARAILTAGERAAALTRQMLAYAGHQDLGRREAVDLAALLLELRTLLDATLSKKASLSLSLAPDSIVEADRATLTQVLMNLLTNASDALSDGTGKIEVRTQRVQQLDARWNDAFGAKVGPGNWLLIEVEDSGIGMDEATRSRVFEPFFTTKDGGHGLGLAACLGIVSSHGGALLLESERGQGSRFSLVWPAADAAPQKQPPSPNRAVSEPCRVLVIDDEELVRTQMRRALTRFGYTVDEAPNGLSGVAAHARSAADVLIIDMTMPDIDGAEVVRRVRAAGSQAAIVLSSGYQAQAATERLPPGSYQVFLPKPFGISELLQAVAQAREQRQRELSLAPDDTTR